MKRKALMKQRQQTIRRVCPLCHTLQDIRITETRTANGTRETWRCLAGRHEVEYIT